MMADDKIELVVRRGADGLLALHDAATGCILPAQSRVEIIQSPHDLTEVVVRFIADPRATGYVSIEVSDGR